MVARGVHCLITYTTPAVNDSFDNFTITNLDPKYCPNGAIRQQNLLTMIEFGRQYITFNFKGMGNAQILFQEKRERSYRDFFTVVIGDGVNNDKVTIYRSKLKEVLGQITVDNITSETEFRSFWIRWLLTGIEAYTAEVAVGLCNDPYLNQVLSAEVWYDYTNCAHISISTTSENSGEWQFSSDGEILGGCNKYWACKEGICVDLWMDDSYYFTYDLYYLFEESYFLKGTCVPHSLQVSSATVGDGDERCPTGTLPRTITNKTGRAEKDVDHMELTVEIIAAIVGGSLGGMTVLLLITIIFFMGCIHISLTRMRRKVDQECGRRDNSNPLPESADLS